MLSKMFRRIKLNNLVRRNVSNDTVGKPTALYEFHLVNGGKIVNFGGFLLPVQYNNLSIVNSHLFTRKSASIFDVSHMLQTEIKGKTCVEYFESTCTADIQGMRENTASLTVFLNDKGGILDDLIVTKISDEHLYVVSNAARRDHDQTLLMKALDVHKKRNPSVDIEVKFFDPSERSLIALQGPKAAEALTNLTDIDISNLYFMNMQIGYIADVPKCRITRCGYTGEDGFEISVASSDIVKVTKALLANENVKLAGLGARDSLRLEASLCLYGNDITANTTPVEGALTWLVARKRREMRNFPGAEVVLEQIEKGPSVKRIGLLSDSGPPARQGAAILNEEGEKIGEVTSGCPSPTLGKNIAMGYVKASYSKKDTRVGLRIRDKIYMAVVSRTPFVSARYYTKPK